MSKKGIRVVVRQIVQIELLQIFLPNAQNLGQQSDLVVLMIVQL